MFTEATTMDDIGAFSICDVSAASCIFAVLLMNSWLRDRLLSWRAERSMIDASPEADDNTLTFVLVCPDLVS